MNNININGSGSVSGGTYDTVTINGSGQVNGDLICHSMTINGSGSVHGNLQAAGSFTINGSGRVDGNITESGSVSVCGSGKVGGFVRCQKFRSSGSASVGGDCEGEDVEISGGGHIGGLLNGETVRIYLYNNNHPKIGSIGGTDIQVKQKTGGNNAGWHIRIFGIEIGNHGESEKPGFLETDTIEGDMIDLAYTRASRVSGRVVKIGPGCVIDQVEYTGSVEIDSENSTVNKVVKG